MKRKIALISLFICALSAITLYFFRTHIELHLREILSAKLSSAIDSKVNLPTPLKLAYQDSMFRISTSRIEISSADPERPNLTIKGLSILSPSLKPNLAGLVFELSALDVELKDLEKHKETAGNSDLSSSTFPTIPCITIPQLPKIDIGNIRVSGNSNREFHGQKVRLLSKDENVFELNLGGKLKKFEFETKAKFSVNKNGVRTLSLDVQSPIEETNIKLVLTQSARCAAELKLSAAGKSLSPLREFVEIAVNPTLDYSISGSLQLSPKKLEASEVSINFGSSSANGALELYRDKLDITVFASHLDIEEILDTKKSTIEQKSADNSSQQFAETELPFNMIPEMEINANLKADRIALSSNQMIKDISARLHSSPQELKLEIERLSALNGKIRGQLQVLHPKEDPRHSLSFEAKNISTDNKEMLNLILPSTTIAASLNASGSDIGAIANSLSGIIESDSLAGEADLSMLGVLFHGISNILDPILGSSDSKKIHCLVSKIKFSDGLGEIAPFLAHASRVAFIGKGSISLPKESIDLGITMRSEEPTLASFLTPLRVSGGFADIKVRPDASATVVEIASSPLSLVGLAARTAQNSAKKMIGQQPQESSICQKARESLELNYSDSSDSKSRSND